MADISKVILPNDASYNIKDASAVHSVNAAQTVVSGETTKEIAKIEVDGAETSIYADDADKILRAAFGEHTVTGNPVSVDAFLGLEVASECKVTMLPIQDLHRYDSPWVGGAGKNKLPFPYAFNSQTLNGLTFTIQDDGGVKINGTATASTNVRLLDTTDAFDGIKLRVGIGSNNVTVRAYSGSSGVANSNGSMSGIFTASSTFNMRLVVSNGTTVNNEVIYPRLYLSTETDYDYAPYENICPISGRDSVVLDCFGKNFINNSASAWEDGAIDSDGRNASSTTMKRTKGMFKVIGGQFYRISGVPQQAQSSDFRFFRYNKNGDFLGYKNYNTTTWELSSITEYIRIRCLKGTDLSSFQFELDTGSATPYEPYVAPETHTHTYSSTVYGGVDDFVSGEGKKTHAYLSYTSFTRTNDHQFYHNVGSNVASRYGRKNIICDRMPTADSSIPTGTAVNAVHTNSSGAIIVHTEEAYSTASAFMTAMGGQINFAVRTSNETEISNTPEDISLIKGVNVLSTDGDSLEVKYSADVKAYIDKKLEELS